MVVMMKRRFVRYATVPKPQKPRKKTAHERLDAQESWIRKRYYDDGAGIYAIAKEVGSSFKNLTAWMDAKGWEKRDRSQAASAHRRARHDDLVDKMPEILRLRRDRRLSIKAISQRVGVSEKTVSAVLADAGLSKLPAMSADSPAPEKILSGHAKLDACRPEVLIAVADGFAGYRIAETFKVSQKTVYDWLRANDVTLVSLTDLQRDIIRLWKTTDLNMRAIGKHLGCSRTYVSMALRKVGIEDRSGIMGRRVGSADGRRAISAVAEDTTPVL
jgi:DNA-binding CsgD family transcriptional regulator